ncbi:hypothetical protein Tsubulata_042695 [Turnera subulata]|uniref:Pentacotripeptide-repeat region of PRORP domain-containing protein n=1 Tax=Turnera subulata TaxID=218843 RepID=A0A9Q0FTG9_9ROSI|nr:hypothetical protein Tsubulata_042695 [Turnera subulata]
MPPKTTTTTTTHILTKTLSRLLPSRIRSFTSISDSTHFSNPQSGHSFCSKTLKFSAKMGFLDLGRQVHATVTKLGFCNVLSLQNQMLDFYLKCSSYSDADTLIDEMPVRNLVTWNTIICGLVDCGSSCGCSIPWKSFYFFRGMLVDGVELDAITVNGLFRACLGLNDIEIGGQVHCFVVKLGFELDCFVSSALVDLYGKCGRINHARRVFDYVLCRDVVLWNVMVACYALHSLAEEAFGVFNLMRTENLVGDGFTFSSLLNACGTMGSCELGRQIHGVIIKLSFDSDVMVATGLVDMYAKTDSIDDARKGFDVMAVRNVVSWNTMIVGYGQHGHGKEAMKLFQEMRQGKFVPDELSVASILSSCGTESAICEIMQVHAYVVKYGLCDFLSIANALTNAYSKCGTIAYALQCFQSVSEPDVVTWTSLIGAYASHGSPKDCIDIFEKMISSGVRPDRISFLAVLSACSHGGFVNEGLHHFSLMTTDYQIRPDLEHYTCLIDLLGRAGLLDEAFNVLTSMPIEHGSDALAAFIGACKIHGDVKLARWASEKLFAMEPKKLANYTVMSNIHASKGDWLDVARLQKLKRNKCNLRTPGCSWVEL